MKVLAYYLPQFHETPENNEWWGKGYTEWTAVRSATPLFEGHYQPHIPLNENYYDLSKKDVMEEQAQLLHRYHVDGVCIYHYYFAEGRKVLEKPAENLLKWTDIDIPFCFSWANAPWVRSWSKFIKGSSWNEKVETSSGRPILLAQDYGGQKEWKAHFEYLKAFFLDPRYIRINGEPLFLIHVPSIVPCLEEMIDFWQSLAAQEEFKHIYIALNDENGKRYAGKYKYFCHEPARAMYQIDISPISIQGAVNSVYDYDAVWNSLLAEDVDKEITGLAGFTGYDDTPRRGQNGVVIQGSTPERFEYYMRRLLIKAKKYHSDFVLLDAWNEWGEGSHLEPDEKFGYGYLDALRRAKEVLKTSEFDNLWTPAADHVYKVNEEPKLLRYKQYWQILDKMLLMYEANYSVGRYIHEKGYQTGVYGLGMIGKHLVQDLIQNDVNIVCGIDQKAVRNLPFRMICPTDEIPEMNLLIVTAEYDFSAIKSTLRERTSSRIVSVSEIMDEAMLAYSKESDRVR